MINKKSSLANKILFVIGVILVLLNLLLFTGATVLNKKAFYKIEEEKANLIATNYAPFISVHLFLHMNKKLEKISKQILKNKNVEKVIIYDHDKKVFEKSKKNNCSTIKTSTFLYQPNSTKKIGKLEIYYSTSRFKKFMKKYFIFLFISFIFILFTFIGLYIYLKKLLYPLKNLADILKNFDHEVKLNVPYTNRDDEIGLISHAIDISNKKTLQYSKELKDLANILINANKNLEKKVQDELQIIREKDKQLLHQSRLAQMGEMINMIAHQWRQPLSAISATSTNISLKLMFDECDKDELAYEVEKISKYSNHLSDTIDDFRNFFKQNKEKKVIALQELIDGTLHIARVSIENHNIQIKTNLCCNKKIKTYPNEVKQVLLNLLKNAQDALLENKIQNPYIEIETICGEKNETFILVKDNAGGIPTDIIDKIFEPYFSTKLEKDGTGLGLYMSKTIIEDHCDGKLYVKNAQEGAVFTIKLTENDDIKRTKQEIS